MSLIGNRHGFPFSLFSYDVNLFSFFFLMVFLIYISWSDIISTIIQHMNAYRFES